MNEVINAITTLGSNYCQNYAFLEYFAVIPFPQSLCKRLAMSGHVAQPAGTRQYMADILAPKLAQQRVSLCLLLIGRIKA